MSKEINTQAIYVCIFRVFRCLGGKNCGNLSPKTHLIWSWTKNFQFLLGKYFQILSPFTFILLKYSGKIPCYSSEANILYLSLRISVWTKKSLWSTGKKAFFENSFIEVCFRTQTFPFNLSLNFCGHWLVVWFCQNCSVSVSLGVQVVIRIRTWCMSSTWLFSFQ